MVVLPQQSLRQNPTCVVGKRQGWENGKSNMEALLYTLEANLTQKFKPIVLAPNILVALSFFYASKFDPLHSHIISITSSITCESLHSSLRSSTIVVYHSSMSYLASSTCVKRGHMQAVLQELPAYASPFFDGGHSNQPRSNLSCLDAHTWLDACHQL